MTHDEDDWDLESIQYKPKQGSEIEPPSEDNTERLPRDIFPWLSKASTYQKKVVDTTPKTGLTSG